MKKPDRTAELPVSDLEGLPGIGAVRRAALAAAGITMRAQLAESTVEDLIRITGIQKAYAAKVLELARVAGSDPAPDPETTPMPIASPPVDNTPPLDLVTITSVQEPGPPVTLDNALARATIALASASQHHQDTPALLREFIRFAKLLQRLPAMAATVSEKRQARIAVRLDRATDRLEMSVSKAKKRSKSSAEDLREALRSDRDRIIDIVVIKAPRKPKGKK